MNAKHEQTRCAGSQAVESGPARYSSKELFRASSRIEIVHGDQTYHLQITRQGKLILTK